MAEEEIIPEVKQQPPQLQPKKEEKKKPEIQHKQPQIKIDDAEIPEKEIKNKMKPEDVKVFRTLNDIYKFDFGENHAFSRAYYGNYLFVVRKISEGRKGYNKINPYVVVRIKKGDDEKIIEKANDKKITIPFFRFDNEFFNTKENRDKFIKFIKDDKYSFDKKPDGKFKVCLM